MYAPEMRLTVYQHSDEFSDYGEMQPKTDYTNPTYYQPEVPVVPRSAQPVQPLNPYDPYAELENPQVPYEPYTPYDSAQMSEYRSPATVEGYTADVGAEQRDAAASGTSTQNGKKRRRLAGLGGIGATIGAFLLKLQGFAFLLKFGLAGITALASVVVYSFFLGWRFAIGLVALLFLHEMGHALVMELKGIPVGNMIFIPMLGAAVSMRQMPQNARDEAEVGIAGPIAGAIAASICLLFAKMPGADPIWAPLAYFGFFMNLFNLIPIVPFDGGRILAAIDRRVWILGFIGLLGFQIWSWLNGNFSIWLLFFVVIAFTQLLSRRGDAKSQAGREYYNVPVSTRIAMSLLYFGLAAVLYLGMTLSHNLMTSLLH